jgi:hypothetical protein
LVYALQIEQPDTLGTFPGYDLNKDKIFGIHMYMTWAEIHKALISHLSLLAEFLILKGLDKDSSLTVGESQP